MPYSLTTGISGEGAYGILNVFVGTSVLNKDSNEDDEEVFDAQHSP